MLLGIYVLVSLEELKIDPDVTQNTVAASKWHQLLLSLHFMRIHKIHGLCLSSDSY